MVFLHVALLAAAALVSPYSPRLAVALVAAHVVFVRLRVRR